MTPWHEAMPLCTGMSCRITKNHFSKQALLTRAIFVLTGNWGRYHILLIKLDLLYLLMSKKAVSIEKSRTAAKSSSNSKSELKGGYYIITFPWRLSPLEVFVEYERDDTFSHLAIPCVERKTRKIWFVAKRLLWARTLENIVCMASEVISLTNNKHTYPF